jgi:hypothetical protein
VVEHNPGTGAIACPATSARCRSRPTKTPFEGPYRSNKLCVISVINTPTAASGISGSVYNATRSPTPASPTPWSSPKSTTDYSEPASPNSPTPPQPATHRQPQLPDRDRPPHRTIRPAIIKL